MPGVKFFAWMLVITLVFDAGFVQQFLVIKKIGMANSLWAVILPMSLNVYNIMILRAYFDGLPKSIMEAAEIDGCTPVQTFFKIVLPMAKAPVAAIGMLVATDAWNEYFRYILCISDTKKYNLQYIQRDVFYSCHGMSANDGRYINLAAASCLIAIVVIIPVVLIIPFFVKHIIEIKTKRYLGDQ